MKHRVRALEKRYGEIMKEVFHRRFSTELGEVELLATRDALVGLEFAKGRVPCPDEPLPLLDDAEAQIRAYLAGERQVFDLPLDLGVGTDFQHDVWRGLQSIGYGETISYAELARMVGRPRAARAVGNANHHNPISIIVPCHRVIAADGSLGGYGGGLWRKRWLLDLEGAHYR